MPSKGRIPQAGRVAIRVAADTTHAELFAASAKNPRLSRVIDGNDGKTEYDDRHIRMLSSMAEAAKEFVNPNTQKSMDDELGLWSHYLVMMKLVSGDAPLSDGWTTEMFEQHTIPYFIWKITITEGHVDHFQAPPPPPPLDTPTPSTTTTTTTATTTTTTTTAIATTANTTTATATTTDAPTTQADNTAATVDAENDEDDSESDADVEWWIGDTPSFLGVPETPAEAQAQDAILQELSNAFRKSHKAPIHATTVYTWLTLHLANILTHAWDPKNPTNPYAGTQLYAKCASRFKKRIHTMVRMFRLPRRKHVSGQLQYGRAELDLVVYSTMTQLRPENRPFAGQGICALLSSFYSSVRISSLVGVHNLDRVMCEMVCFKHVVVTRLDIAKFNVDLTIVAWKAHANDEAMTRQVTFQAVDSKDDLFIDPSTWFVLHLLELGAFQDFQTLDELLKDDAHRILRIKPEFAEHPVFQKGVRGPKLAGRSPFTGDAATYHTIHQLLNRLYDAANLPRVGINAWRRGFASFFRLTSSDHSLTGILMGHRDNCNVIDKHYSDASNRYDLVAIRNGANSLTKSAAFDPDNVKSVLDQLRTTVTAAAVANYKNTTNKEIELDHDLQQGIKDRTQTWKDSASACWQSVLVLLEPLDIPALKPIIDADPASAGHARLERLEMELRRQGEDARELLNSKDWIEAVKTFRNALRTVTQTKYQSTAMAGVWQRKRDHTRLLVEMDQRDFEEHRKQATRPDALSEAMFAFPDGSLTSAPLGDTSQGGMEKAEEQAEEDAAESEAMEMATMADLDNYGRLEIQAMMMGQQTLKQAKTQTNPRDDAASASPITAAELDCQLFYPNVPTSKPAPLPAAKMLSSEDRLKAMHIIYNLMYRSRPPRPLHENHLARWEDGDHRCPLCVDYTHDKPRRVYNEFHPEVGKVWRSQTALESHMQGHTEWADTELRMRSTDSNKWFCPACRKCFPTQSLTRCHCVSVCPEAEYWRNMKYANLDPRSLASARTSPILTPEQHVQRRLEYLEQTRLYELLSEARSDPCNSDVKDLIDEVCNEVQKMKREALDSWK